MDTPVLSSKAVVHCWSSRLPYTAGLPGCRTLLVFLTAVHCWSSRPPYTAGLPDCCTMLVFQAAVHCWLTRPPYTAGCPGRRTLLVVQACHRTLHQPQLTPEVVVSCSWGEGGRGRGACLHRRCSVVMLPVKPEHRFPAPSSKLYQIWLHH